MKSAPIPNNEKERLAALSSYQILDTEPEEPYDQIAFLASHICQTPKAVLSLIDDERIWYKSLSGLEIKPREGARDISFCGHVVDYKNVMEVQNALQDPRFADNPGALAAKDPTIFYAGAPLIDPHGLCIGSLCVVHHQPWQLSEDQKKALMALAQHAVAHIVFRKTNRQLQQTINEMALAQKKIAEQEAQLVRATKMAAIGEMSATMAHEINNPLAILRAAFDVLQAKQVFAQSQFANSIKYRDIIDQNITRVQNIVFDLRKHVKDL